MSTDIKIVNTPDDPLVIAINKMKLELSGLNRPRRVLFVEDSESMRMIFSRISKDFNCEVDYAEDGMTGCDMAIKGSYDLVILDINLPVRNGIECFECIRKVLGDLPPVTFFTGTLDNEQAERIEKTGFASFIRKPHQFNIRFITSFFHNFGIFKKPILETEPLTQ